jgi:hypothetical protein
LSGTLPALPQANITVREKGTSLTYQPQLYTQVNKIALFADTMVKHDVKLSTAKRRRNLIFDYLGSNMAAYGFIPLLDGLGTPQVYPYRAIEFQRPTTWRYLRITEDNANFLS